MTTLAYNLTLFGYIVFLLLTGVYYYITSENEQLSDYLLGGRDVGIWPMAISDAASVQTGFIFLAWVGFGYTTGFIGLFYGFGIVFMYLFIYRFVGSRFRTQSEALDSQTVVDHLALSYQGSIWGSRIRNVGVLVVGVFLTVYIGGQVVAIGELVETTTNFSYNLGIVVGSVLVVIYVTLGGFNASIWTDFIQGLIAISAITILPAVMIYEIGGINAFVTQARSIDPTLVSVTRDNSSLFLLMVLGYYGRSMGVAGQPHALMRLQSIRSERLISSASIVTTTFLALSYIAPLFVGVAGRILYPNIGNPETTALVALQDFFPPIIAGIFAAGVLSIVISTTDSMLIVISANVTRWCEANLNISTKDSFLILLSRIAIIIVAFLGGVLAYFQPASIFAITEIAYIGLGTSLGIPLMASLWWKETTSQSICVTMVAGLVSTSIAQLFFQDYSTILPWIATIATAIIATTLSNPDIDTSSSPEAR